MIPSSSFLYPQQSIDITTDISPYQKFSYALNSQETQRQCPRRFQQFLNYLQLKELTIEANIDSFYKLIEKNGTSWLELELLKFFRLQNQRAERNEISTETIKNYLKPIKLFCQMNGVLINWKIITKGIKKGNRYSSDRPPTIAEIGKLLGYPDRRIKPIVLVMISSGMRVGSWNYLKWGHISPITRNGSIVAAKIKLYNTKTNCYYYSFITPEAYFAVNDWMTFRASFGEKISADSWVMRNLWQIKSQRFGNYLGLAKHPIKFSSDGIRMLINDAWKIQGVRDKNDNNKQYPFKSLHGFRKFFESECQKASKSINVSILLSHDIGITQHYYKPKEDDLLEDYLKSVELLTIDEEHKLKTHVNELTQKNNEKEYIIKGKLQEKDEELKSLKQKYELDMKSFEERMENKLQQILLKINFEKLSFGE
jgi:integrase